MPISVTGGNSQGVGTVTRLSDLINPTVWSDFVQERFPTRLILGQFAQDDNTLVGQPGDTISFPDWGDLSAAQELDETTEIAVEHITATSLNATVQEVGKGFAVTDKAVIASLGDPTARGVSEIARVVAEKIDDDLAKVLRWQTGDPALRTGLVVQGAMPYSVGTYSTTGTGSVLNLDLLIDAVTSFPDSVGMEDIQAIIVHTQTLRKLMKVNEYVEEVASNGLMGRVMGIPVIRSDRTGVHGKALMVLRSPLQLLYKRRPITEYERKASWRRTHVYTSVHYGARRADGRLVTVVNHDTTLSQN